MLKVIEERSSIRAYKNETLPEETLKALVEAGLRAPTARNEQEIHFSVVDTKSAVMAEIQNELNPNAEKTFYYGAPTLIMLSGDDSFPWSAVDAGIAVENISLAAQDMGLGNLIIGCIKGVMTGPNKAHYNEVLGIPEGYTWIISIAVGYPDTEKPQHNIDPVSKVTYVG